jgi:hypothetical protein
MRFDWIVAIVAIALAFAVGQSFSDLIGTGIALAFAAAGCVIGNQLWKRVEHFRR